MKCSYLILFLVVSFFCAACHKNEKTPGEADLHLTIQKSGTQALLVGVSAVNKDVAWVSGAQGTILRTTNGGNTWESRSIPGTDSLQFRDIYAVNTETVYVLSIGKGSSSRIYKTTDGGKSWDLQFKSNNPNVFLDCMAFWNSQSGIAFSDAVNNKFIIIKTDNGGHSWERIPAGRLPAAGKGEGSFAASGTCVAVQGSSTAWIATGSTGQPRVLRTTDRGATWQSYPIPLDAGTAAGGASLIFRDKKHGFVLGGSISKPATSDSTAAVTDNGGKTWKLVANPLQGSPVYGAVYIPGAHGIIAVGPGGVAYSTNGGRSWQHVDTVDTWAVSFADPHNGWLAGPDGRIVHAEMK